MALKDTSSAPLVATPSEIDEAIRWAIRTADLESSRVIRRDSGFDRKSAKELEAMYRKHRRALTVLSERRMKAALSSAPEGGS